MRLLLAAVLALSACTSLVPSTVARLSALSPIEADPADFAVAVGLPDGLGLGPEGAHLVLAATRADTGDTTEARYRLEAATVAPPEGTEAWAEVVTFRVAPADLATIRAQQALIRRWKAEAGDATEGSLSIGLAGCRKGPGPERGAKGAVWLRIEAGAPFLPLVRPTRVTALLGAEDIAALAPCAAAEFPAAH